MALIYLCSWIQVPNIVFSVCKWLSTLWERYGLKNNWKYHFLPEEKEFITNKVITLDLVIENVIFTQRYFVLPITNPIILGSDFLDTYFTVLDMGDHTIILGCADYMLMSSLTYDSVYDWCLMKIAAPAATKVLYKQFCKEIKKNTLMYISVV